MEIKKQDPQIKDIKQALCRLCRDSVNEENFETGDNIMKGILEVVFLDVDLNETVNNLRMCKTCSNKLLAAYEFKSTCVDIEDTIDSYIENNKMLPIDLMKVYIKQRGQAPQNGIKNMQVCRLCMQLVLSNWTPFLDVETMMIQQCIPEVKLQITKEPIICDMCLQSLNAYTSFIKDCLNMKLCIKKERDNLIGGNDHYLSEMQIKQEEIEIKSEERSTKSKQISDQKCNVCNESERGRDNFNIHLPKAEVYEFDDSYQDCHNKCNLEHADPFEEKMRQSEDPYQTLSKGDLIKHKLKHANSSAVKMHQCDKCPYQSMKKSHLNVHKLRHADRSKVNMFSCDNCSYQTLYKSDLKKHKLIHLDPSKVQMFKCDNCSFQTLYKDRLTRHKLKHADLLEMFKCEECPYQTIYVNNFKIHKLKHADPCKVDMLKCEDCPYQTLDKSHFKRHKLKHADPSELEMFTCNSCSYQTTHKGNLKKHIAKHANQSEVDLLKCEDCSYRTIDKRYLKRHELKHLDLSQVEMFNCDICSYRTLHKNNLKRHKAKHANIYKVDRFSRH